MSRARLPVHAGAMGAPDLAQMARDPEVTY